MKTSTVCNAVKTNFSLNNVSIRISIINNACTNVIRVTNKSPPKINNEMEKKGKNKSYISLKRQSMTSHFSDISHSRAKIKQ